MPEIVQRSFLRLLQTETLTKVELQIPGMPLNVLGYCSSTVSTLTFLSDPSPTISTLPAPRRRKTRAPKIEILKFVNSFEMDIILLALVAKASVIDTSRLRGLRLGAIDSFSQAHNLFMTVSSTTLTSVYRSPRTWKNAGEAILNAPSPNRC
ncbi:hypothetical protein CC1G_04017 [Coprinopsis cinerea okayama7|uniref:Uncharacterized protein n=1 Tax=Coprinopsis cinerea (strain Okayama-7 / 130 / ATCC MYA-4618 / FGSC 9003) TaxID=240176 RepID=A8N8H0_COPC7|nr:hypothetical protein CC1G_04017 [Coprinopsis cinerea okayama7\|eukprot:XP_001831126.1 hypothetical protein CC1G_04017 [Coprinopsis cinerea okayama7\